MNLTIHERFGGGFCVKLSPADVPTPVEAGQIAYEAYREDDTLTLTFGSVDAAPVTFTSFDDLARVLHGDLRLSLGE